MLLSGGRQCWLNKTDVLLWAHTGEVTHQGGSPTMYSSLHNHSSSIAEGWQRYSLSYIHNQLWRGDPMLRYTSETVNATYGGPHSHFLGTLSYTSLLPIDDQTALVIYDLRLPTWRGIPAVQFDFSCKG